MNMTTTEERGMSCGYTANGSFVSHASLPTIFEADSENEHYANLATLGENCENRTCTTGVCFRHPNNTATCTRMVWGGQTGCARTNYACVAGLDCVADTCVRTAKPTTPLTPHMQQEVQAVIEFVVRETVKEVYNMFNVNTHIDENAVRRATATHALSLLRTYTLDAQLLAQITDIAAGNVLRMLSDTLAEAPFHEPATENNTENTTENTTATAEPPSMDAQEIADADNLGADDAAALQAALQSGRLDIDGETIQIPPEILKEMQQQQQSQQRQEQLKQSGTLGKLMAFFLSLYLQIRLYIFSIVFYIKQSLSSRYTTPVPSNNVPTLQMISDNQDAQ